MQILALFACKSLSIAASGVRNEEPIFILTIIPVVLKCHLLLDWSPGLPVKQCEPYWGSGPVSAAGEPAWWNRKRVTWFSLWILPRPPAAKPVIGPDCLLASPKPLCGDVSPPIRVGFSQWLPAHAELHSSHLTDGEGVWMRGVAPKQTMLIILEA